MERFQVTFEEEMGMRLRKPVPDQPQFTCQKDAETWLHKLVRGGTTLLACWWSGCARWPDAAMLNEAAAQTEVRAAEFFEEKFKNCGDIFKNILITNKHHASTINFSCIKTVNLIIGDTHAFILMFVYYFITSRAAFISSGFVTIIPS